VALDWADLPALFPTFTNPDVWLPLLQRHAALLVEAAPHTRVSSVPDEDVVTRQYAESLEILRLSAAEAPAVKPVCVDVGSGGGFPGLVIAIVRPEAAVHLVEPLHKRARLLERCVDELGLANVEVHAIRAEEAGRGALRDQATVATARAVAALPVLLEYTAPLVAPGGLIALPKGSGLPAELEASLPAQVKLGCGYLGARAMRREISTTLAVALFRKLSRTAEGYPRRPGAPARRPL
jgi:16S rRNA (guanine527-N7)-methyltransferase